MNIEEFEKSLQKLPEEELVKILDKNNFSCEAEFEALVAEMENRGMSGRIIEIDGSPDDEQGQEIIDYINYHGKLPQYKNQTDENTAMRKAIKTLENKNSTLENQKFSILTLAHIGRLDALNALEKFQKIAPAKLASWAFTAIGECQMFLEESLTNKPKLKIKKMPK